MRRNWVLLITFLMMSVGILSGCTQQQTPPPGNTNTVTIKDFAFNPSTITIKAGDNVTWSNEDSAPHQVKEDTGLFLSNSLSNGQSFTYQFTIVGTFNYTCNIHSSMHGKVIVE